MTEINPTDLRRKFSYDPVTGEVRVKVAAGQGAKLKVGDLIGYKAHNGYLRVYYLDRELMVHRVAFALMTGRWPEKHLDHINGDPADNRWENLREVDDTENGRNAKRSKANKSGTTGVSFDAVNDKWRATITVSGRQISLGRHATLQDAIDARKAAERKHGFHPNHGRVEA